MPYFSSTVFYVSLDIRSFNYFIGHSESFECITYSQYFILLVLVLHILALQGTPILKTFVIINVLFKATVYVFVFSNNNSEY